MVVNFCGASCPMKSHDVISKPRCWGRMMASGDEQVNCERREIKRRYRLAKVFAQDEPLECRVITVEE